ncbi:MAG: hypothetical protein FRX48_07821 [Lasallia pustulata]|uniref:NADH:ubiquinone oxidoreductase intermediate-associated protein 30 domain-containing protein n=1 Tax=Lasallia pustulata TaxID=136370 RepID=A0A5M8PGR0_9LECA|nr:MAG: hypothetical protein FRX48_07821 [Lasallia pustulata]
MRPSPQLLQPGFLRRSLDEFKRLSRIAIKQEGIQTPTTPYHLIDFSDPATISACKTMSDIDIGGFSQVSLDYVPKTAEEPAHARFHGTISIELPPNRPHIQRTGYAAWRNKDRPPTIFGKALWDIDPYAFLALRVKSDGRKYFVNVQTESIVPTDLHQHRLYARRPGQWETIVIDWNEFVRTNYGAVVEPQTEMLRQKVRTVGIGLIDRVPGPYDLAISGVWATNRLRDGQTEKDEKAEREEGQTRDGKKDGAKRRTH